MVHTSERSGLDVVMLALECSPSLGVSKQPHSPKLFHGSSNAKGNHRLSWWHPWSVSLNVQSYDWRKKNRSQRKINSIGCIVVFLKKWGRLIKWKSKEVVSLDSFQMASVWSQIKTSMRFPQWKVETSWKFSFWLWESQVQCN